MIAMRSFVLSEDNRLSFRFSIYFLLVVESDHAACLFIHTPTALRGGSKSTARRMYARHISGANFGDFRSPLITFVAMT